jgi:hypothetical protein
MPANAADLPLQAYKSAAVVAPVYNWTGIYVGANAGYRSGKQDPLGLFSNDFSAFNYTLSGGMIGGTFGAQIQSGPTRRTIGFSTEPSASPLQTTRPASVRPSALRATPASSPVRQKPTGMPALLRALALNTD